MTKAIPDIKKKRGRPKTGVGTPILVRFTPEIVDAIDTAIKLSGADISSRPDFVRLSVAEKLGREP